MKRTPLQRRTPLRSASRLTRTGMRRKPKPNKYNQRPRDLAMMGWVKQQPCVLRGIREAGPCEYRGGVSEADHAGDRGLSRKCPDNETIPACSRHHLDRTDSRGFFALSRWPSKAARREWIDEQIAETQARYLAQQGRY